MSYEKNLKIWCDERGLDYLKILNYHRTQGVPTNHKTNRILSTEMLEQHRDHLSMVYENNPDVFISDIIETRISWSFRVFVHGSCTQLNIFYKI